MAICIKPETARKIEDEAKAANLPIEDYLRQRGYPEQGVTEISKLVRNTLSTPVQQAVTKIRDANTKMRDTPRTQASMRKNIRQLMAAQGLLDIKKVKSNGPSFGNLSIAEQMRMVSELGAEATGMTAAQVRSTLTKAGKISGTRDVRTYKGAENIVKAATGKDVVGDLDTFMRKLNITELAAVRQQLLSTHELHGKILIQEKGKVAITTDDLALLNDLRKYKAASSGERGIVPTAIRLRDVFEPSTRFFERLDMIAPGAKDKIMRPVQRAQASYLIENTEQQHYLKTVKSELGITQEGSKNIMIDGLWDQPEARAGLDAMGIKKRPALTAEEQLAKRILRQEFFEPLFNKHNQARAAMGLDPIIYEANYMPMMRDLATATERGYDMSKITTESLQKNRAAWSQVDTRHSKQRVSSSDLPFKLDAFAMTQQYVNSVLRVVHLGPEVARVKRLFTTQFNINKLAKKHGADAIPASLLDRDTVRFKESARDAEVAIRHWLEQTLGVRSKAESVADRLVAAADPIARVINRNLAVGFLWGSLRFFAVQPTVIARAWGQMGFFGGPKYLMHGAIDVMHSFINAPEGTRIGELTHLRGAKAKSSALQTRAMDAFVEDTYSLMQAGTSGKIKQGWGKFIDVGLKFGQTLDEMSANITWNAAARYGEKKLGLKGDELINFADDMTLYTNGSGSQLHRAPIQATAFGRLATLFQTFAINDFFYLTRQVMQAEKFGLTPTAAKSKLKAIVTYATITALVNSLYETIGMDAPFSAPITTFQEEIEERGKSNPQALLSAVTELLQVIPSIGGTIRYGGSIGGPAVEYVTEAARLASGRRPARPWWVTLGRLGGIPGTAPTYQLTRATKEQSQDNRRGISRGGSAARGIPTR